MTLDDGGTMRTDEVVVTGMDIPLPFYPGPDILLCGNDEYSIILDPAFGDFMWSDSVVESSYAIDNTLTFALTITNMSGACSDELEVITIALPFISLDPYFALLCDHEFPDFYFDPDMSSYMWKDGSTDLQFTAT